MSHQREDKQQLVLLIFMTKIDTQIVVGGFDMRYTYKVRELGLDKPVQDMQAMSLKKLKRKLDHTKTYDVEYTNKKGNFIVATIKGKESN
jgi:hypothetical protein